MLQIRDNGEGKRGGKMDKIIILLFAIPGVLIFYLGKYIKKSKYIEILKSYDGRKTYDRDGLSKYACKLMQSTGIITASVSLLFFILSFIFVSTNIRSIFLVVYIFVMSQYIIRLRFSCKKYEIKGEKK